MSGHALHYAPRRARVLVRHDCMRGGGGSLSLFTALRSCPLARMGRGRMSSLCFCCRCVLPSRLLWLLLRPPVCARVGGAYVFVGVQGDPWHSTAILLCG